MAGPVQVGVVLGAAYVCVEYTVQNALGRAEIGYRYPLGRLIPLANGDVLPVEALRPGTHFLLEDNGVATVTKVDPPQPWSPPDADHDCFGNAPRSFRDVQRQTNLPEHDALVFLMDSGLHIVYT